MLETFQVLIDEIYVPVKRWRELDPISSFRQQLVADGYLDDAAIEALEQEIETAVNEATRFAEESPDPPLEALYDHVYTEPH